MTSLVAEAYTETINITETRIVDGFTCKSPEKAWVFTGDYQDDDLSKPLWDEKLPVSDVSGYNSGLCPKNNNAVLAWNNSHTTLKTAIGNLTHGGWTGVHNGLKWGFALLDPSSSTLMDSITSSAATSKPAIDALQVDRPFLYDRPNTRKYLILLSDGRTMDKICWTDRANDTDVDCLSDGDGYVGTLNAMDMCDEARSKGIIVFSIAFDLKNVTSDDAIDAKALLNYCATSTSTYFDVDGEGLDNAFKLIAGTIQQLKLVQ